MSDKRWYHSLYWRIGLGLVVFVALMIGAQSALFLWMLDQTAGSMPARSPRRLAVLVASDVAAALNDNPTLDLDAYIRQQYGAVFQPFVVIMRDGRIVSNRGAVPDELQEAVTMLANRAERFPREGRGMFGPGPPPRLPRGRGGTPPDGTWEVAPILTGTAPAGRVVVLASAPLSRIVREFGPTVGGIGATILAGGAVLIALFVFRPAQRRLQHLEAAARRLAAGDLSARAADGGGDEVASVAREFNRMADELTARAVALSVSERGRRQLLADVSHELRTPLTAMRGYIDTLRMRELPLDADKRDRYLSIIDDETHRLERVVGDLLDLARLESGGGTLVMQRVSVTALFQRVAARHEREAEQRGNRIVSRVEANADYVQGDPDRLEQAVQNLAANALRHTPPGTEIVLSSRAEGGRIYVQVRDSGPGISSEQLPLVFDRFYKGDSSRHSGGSGLGLSIVKAIVERHGGVITARNDGGAVLEIVLPAPA